MFRLEFRHREIEDKTRKRKALTVRVMFGDHFRPVSFFFFSQGQTLQAAQSHRGKFIFFITRFSLAKDQKTNRIYWQAICIDAEDSLLFNNKIN